MALTTFVSVGDDLDWDSAALPFTFADPHDELSTWRVRDPLTINHVAGDAWKYLRLSRTTSRSALEDLSIFPHMQLDIVLEILAYLQPLELVQVSHTNKSFRGLLSSSFTDSLWRNSFLVEETPDPEAWPLPRCPSDISGRWWTSLVSGPQICWECGQSDTGPRLRNYTARMRGLCGEEFRRRYTWVQRNP
ncbi:hypothetical protein C8R45DRAFT_1075535 [Mycena sanguinolenta]|nr:hypothetical protein C8R45DRAFT_1075535 [Mycena sanguinolenta]